MSCILCHQGIQLILASSLARPAFLSAGKGSGGMFLLYPRHTKYVGVYSFRFSVRPFVSSYVRSFVGAYVRSFVRMYVFQSQGQSFCVKVYKTSYFENL